MIDPNLTIPEIDAAGSSIGALFVARATTFPNRVFLSTIKGDGIETTTYSDAARRVAGIVRWLQDQGFKPGDRVMCYLDEHEPLLWFMLACAVSGVIPVPLAPAYRPKSLRQLAELCRAKAIFTLPALVGSVADAEQSVWVLDNVSELSPIEARAVAVLDVPEPLGWLKTCADAIDPRAVMAIQPTSGSTGLPKLVHMLNVHYPWGASVLADTWIAEREGSDAAILLTGALTHGGGQLSLALAIYLGGRLCIPPDIDTAVRLEHAEKLEPSVLAVVPRQLRSLVEQYEARHSGTRGRPPFCGNQLRRIYTGGAVIDEHLLARFEQQGVEILEVYGSTEMCFVAFTRPGQRRPGYVGKVLSGVHVKVSSDNELLVRTPGMTSGYVGGGDLNRVAFDEDGYFRSGDLGIVDADGYLKLLGRKRDVLHSAEGSYIYPAVIEAKLEEIPWVDQACLLGDGKPFVIALLVIREPPAAVDEFGWLPPTIHGQLYERAEYSLHALNAQLDTFACIRSFFLFAERFPDSVYQKLATGKIARRRENAVEVYRSWVEQLYCQPPSLDIPASAAAPE